MIIFILEMTTYDMLVRDIAVDCPVEPFLRQGAGEEAAPARGLLCH